MLGLLKKGSLTYSYISVVLADFFAPTAEIELYCKTLETARNLI